MDDLHVAVFSTGDLMYWTALTVITFGAAVLAAYLAGHNAGARAHRAETEARARADIDDTVDEYGPVRVPLDGMDLDEWDVDRPRYHRRSINGGPDGDL